MTRRTRFASACLAVCILFEVSGCSSQSSETPQVNGMSPGDYRDDLDKKAAESGGLKKATRSSRRR